VCPTGRARGPALLALAVLVSVSHAASEAAGPDPGSRRLPHAVRLPRFEGPARPVREAPTFTEPYAVRLRDAKAAPTTGVVRPHAEYEPMAGVLFRYDRSDWAAVISEMVAALTGDPGSDEKAWVLVSSNSQRNQAQNSFANAGADLSQVVFLTVPTETIWIRDYGPQFVWLDDTLAVVDNRYFTSRPSDNFVPRLLAQDVFVAPAYEMGLFHFGGNLLASADRQGFVTSLVNSSNAAFGAARVAELFAEFHGIDTLHVFPTLPSSVDATGHIDMWFQLVDQDTVVIAEFLPGSNTTAMAITEEAALYMEQVLGYEVFRVPAHNGPHPWAANTHFTYTNAFRVNQKIFVPTYGRGGAAHAARDAQALATWQQAAPGAEIVPIDAWDLVYAAGSVHCIVMQVPRYLAAAPAASVISPAGGEVLVPGATHSVEWSATDDALVASIDLLYSTDGGGSWAPIASGLPHTRRHDWVVPDEPGDETRIQVVARDAEARTGEATSAGVFSIVGAARHTYDFATGAGVGRRAFGHQTATWAGVSGYRLPPNLTTELTPGEYLALSASDASGDDGDANRFRSAIPPSNFSSTHVFELTLEEPPGRMRELALVWEGYADSCLQVELYVWDRVAGEWCDGAGHCGQKRYLDNASGNGDVVMRGFIRQDIERYVDPAGRVTLLVYAAATAQETFHDYVAVTVTHVLDSDGDNVPDGQDCAPADGTSWALPGEVPSLHPSPDAGGTRLDWTPPADLGGQAVLYDVLASSTAEAFDLAACIAPGTGGTSATDLDVLAPDELRSYLVRATNGCGPGTLGADTGGTPRSEPNCP